MQTAADRAPRTEPSIRRRLGAGFALLALLLFGAMAGFEYFAFDSELERIRHQELEGTAAVVAHLIEDTRGETDMQLLRHRLDDIRLGHRGVRVWLLDPGGGLVYGDPPPPATLGTAAGRPPVARLRLADGRTTRGITQHVGVGRPVPIDRLLLTIDDDDPQRLRRSLARTLVLALVAGTTLASLLGLWLSRRALKPLQAISAQANALSASAIGARLPETGIDAEIRDLVASFNRALDRIELALRQQESFSADVAHELNTPLATLIAGNEVALATGADVARLREQLADNLDELHRLEGIVADMLFLARADQGARARRFPPASLAALVRDVIDYHDAAIADARLRAVVEGDLVAEVDAPLLRRAVSNLLSNATRFADPDSELRVCIAAAGPDIRLTVTNDGRPLAADQLPRLFDRFYRAEPSRSGSDRHHGLGLAIVAAIARMHGGRPLADSDGQRTTIGLLLPGRPPPA